MNSTEVYGQISQENGRLKAENAGLRMINAELQTMLQHIQFAVEMEEEDSKLGKIKEITDRYAYLCVWLEINGKD